MNKLPILGLLLITTLGFLFYTEQATPQNNELLEITNLYKQFKQTYPEFIEDNFEYRLSVFIENYKMIQNVNSQNNKFQLGITQFFAYTNEEFKQKFLTLSKDNSSTPNSAPTIQNQQLPAEVDWVSKGLVPPVPNEGYCGATYAFAAVSTMSTLYSMQVKHLVELSTQQIIDCDTNQYGCEGGFPSLTYEYAEKYGLETDRQYPYTSGGGGHNGHCKYNKNDVVFKPSGYFNVTQSAQDIKTHLTTQTLAADVNAGNMYFQFYTGGVIDATDCPTQLDHSLVLVGYNTTTETPYWNFQNQWGTGWGIGGYVEIAITNNGPGICGAQDNVQGPLAD